MRITRPDRRVITFYSFKGGVGRTMALANVAFRLADVHALNVIAVDWDLEAPGLHAFFGVDPKVLAEARGVLDYFEEWSSALERGDTSPPQVGGWLLPITEGPAKPRHGSLRLLVAGKQDGAYGPRLGRLNWQELYASRGGAAAVEVLRKQLVDDADIVLVDSRTGFTDVGGICTVQLPDAVVLMMAPNRQSLEGIERVARGIAGANPEERAGRTRQQVWLSVARVPIVEETGLAKEWFAEQTGRFEEGANAGLWRRDDHPRGLETFTIPQRSRWGFAENLVVAGELVEPEEPLFVAYGRLTLALLEWMVGTRDIAFPTGTALQRPDDRHVAGLRALAREAEQRNDIAGLLSSLIQLGEALHQAGKNEKALEVFERARSIALGREARREVAHIDLLMGVVLKAQGNEAEAVKRWRDAGAQGQTIGHEYISGAAELFLGIELMNAGEFEDAFRRLLSSAGHFRHAGHENEMIQAIDMSIKVNHLMLHRLREIEGEEHASAKDKNAAPKPGTARSTRKRRPKP